MKKQYTAPAAQQISLLVEGMMAASKVQYQSDETVNNEASILSNQSVWNSNNWSGAAEED